MTDIVNSSKRSEMMASIRSKNTRPEKIVRSWLHRNGYRFRIHRKDLPGSPDIVLAKYRTIILVNGCFWHRHNGCNMAHEPKSRAEWWNEKFQKTVNRDKSNVAELEKLNWHVCVVWECEVRSGAFTEKIKEFMETIF